MSISFRKLGLTLGVFCAAVTFSACATTSTPAQTTEEKAPGMEIEKKGDTTLTGTLTNRGGKYFLEVSGKQPQEVESYSVDLASYVDKTVTITGQFSGSTLFAGKIEAQ